ncbi:alpha/beta hydrolase [Nonomuraea sp. NPDC050451]|uniref:alpha/beta hydrolase n=1 Tax=Nonomuraea sp. NPDC050451 TaxID=3364364 RepID=UPI00378D4227
MRALVGVVGLMVGVLTACGGAASTGAAAPGHSRGETSMAPAATSQAPVPEATTSAPLPTGPNVSGCFTEADGKIFKHDGDLPGVITGDGPVGVVITYERRGNVCTWRPLSDRLVAVGYRVLLYARRSTTLPEDAAVAMGKRLAKESGVKRIFLVGGSIGATTAVPAALRLGPKAAGVVAVSGEISAENAARLTVPLLQIGSENDGYGGADDLAEAHAAATKAPDNQTMVIPGESLHASALFGSPHGKDVLDRIVAFMDRHKG